MTSVVVRRAHTSPDQQVTQHVRRPRTVSEGDRTQGSRHRVLAGGAEEPGHDDGFLTLHAACDPIVLALAQLVRDRWAAEGGGDQVVVAMRRPKSEGRTVTTVAS